MQCLHCNNENPGGALFCLQCSMPLQKDLLALTLSNIGTTNGVTPLQTEKKEVSEAPRLTVIKNRKPTGESIELPCGPYSTPLTIGRNDLPRGIVVDVDLTGLDGRKMGVSRQHAQIDFNTTGLIIKDIGSTHGTFVNKRKLSQTEAVTLENGDEIMLANMILWVQMK